jgi:hypothetical protein
VPSATRIADEREGQREEIIAHYREALRRFAQVRSPDAEVVRAALHELGAPIPDPPAPLA